MKFKLVETYLFEDIAAVKRQYSYIPEEDFDKIIRLDPTFDENRDSVGKYGKWLLGLYKKDNPLNTPGATTFLQMYDEIKNDNSKKIEKDIGKFKSFRELYDAISSAEDVELSDRQKLRKKQANKDYDIVWQNDNWAIFVPNTWEADVNLGKGTKWCTADSREESGKKYYDQYLREGGKYYVIINKHNKEDKYQFHFESKQFMDKDDSPIDVAEFVDASSAAGMRTFFEHEGYEVDDYARTEFEDWDEVIDRLFGYPGEEVSINASVDVLGVLFGTDEDWYNIFSIIDALNGYYTIGDIYETLLYPHSNTVISTLQDTFNDYDFQLPDELEDDWDSQEEFLEEFSKIINDYITDYYLEDLTGTNYPQSYFKVEDNNLTISMDRNVLKNEIIDLYAYTVPELLLEYESAGDVIYDLTQAAKADFRGVSDEEAVLLMFIGTDNLKCEIDPSELISNLVYYITAGHAKEIISKLKNYFESGIENEV